MQLINGIIGIKIAKCLAIVLVIHFGMANILARFSRTLIYYLLLRLAMVGFRSIEGVSEGRLMGSLSLTERSDRLN